MAKTININGTEYEIPELDFNAVAELSENGVDIFNRKIMKKSPIQLARGIAAWIMGTDIDTAGNEIGEHLIAYREMPPLADILLEELHNSNFFKRLSESRADEGTVKQPQDHKRKAKTEG